MDDNEHREAIRGIVLGSVQLVQVFEQIWGAYQELFDRAADMEDDVLHERVLEATMELEHNMTDVLDQVRGHLYVLTGVYEPLPVDKVDDFEKSVLSTLAELDKGVDLDLYRIEEDEDEDV